MKVSETWNFTSINSDFQTMKADGVSISFYPGTQTLNIRGSKSEITANKLSEFTIISDHEVHEEDESFIPRESQENRSERTEEQCKSDHVSCSNLIDTAMREISEQFRHEISKRLSEISVLISGKTTTGETELQAENRDLKQKLQDFESCYVSLKQKTNV